MSPLSWRCRIPSSISTAQQLLPAAAAAARAEAREAACPGDTVQWLASDASLTVHRRTDAAAAHRRGPSSADVPPATESELAREVTMYSPVSTARRARAL